VGAILWRRRSSMSPEDLRNRFEYHPADTEYRQKAHEQVREQCFRAAEFINNNIREGREKSLAVTKLEEAMFWANAAIARQES